ncbi:phosphoglycerate dehydrogenase-like oxidoreductase [Desulfocapsa sulfexigens DSM 10523]|uniref:Phosphoglycerate dehydrogenase-like oxidoreductase n=1 Tax=Desulfocapsa sulfexigens (strain DSM 10523 / SB164P1) TaxID=1167006 RepID=M1P6D0_DESSD|nr:phosphoglycerate dehydrogenase [Desulfocapsa sulfexigens]AGF78983.1 phosphoglycerate dehydrogenase-like oxidoreductase [Desulfocapsa sulfexigens DSM 10523]
MNTTAKVAVCSRSFSLNTVLREELLQRYKNVNFNDIGAKLEGKVLVDFLRGHDKAITALEVIGEEVLSQLPELTVISKYGVGLDMIDMNAMKKYGIKLGWTGGVNRRSVSELVISFAIALLRHVVAANREVLSGTWRQHMGGYLSGRTVGIIGCGYIGKDLVKMLQPFDCPILVNDILDYSEFYDQYNVKAVSVGELLTQSDVVTLHVPLDDSTRNILTAERLALMKADAILINAARGGLVDEQALKEMLQTGRLAAAAFDVFAVEPPQDQELLELSNFIVTPHIGGSAREAILAMGRAAIEGLDNNNIV